MTFSESHGLLVHVEIKTPAGVKNFEIKDVKYI